MILTPKDIGSRVTCLSKAACWIAFVIGGLVFIGWILGGLTMKSLFPGLNDASFGVALVTMSGIVLCGTLIWWTAVSLNRIEAQRRSAERTRDLYRQMFLHSNDSIAVIDPHGYYVEQNVQHQRLLGYVSDELRGQTPALYLGASEFDRVAGNLAQTGSYRGELLYRTKSGTQVPIELSAFSVRDEHGQVICHVGMKRDITDRKRSEQIQREARDELERRVWERTSALVQTIQVLTIEIDERKRAEEALRESEGRFRVIFNQASIGIAEVRSDGRFLRVNTKLCEILGRPAETLLTMTFQTLTHPDDLADNVAFLHRALAGRQDDYSIEKRYFRPNGTVVWCRLSVSLVRTSAGAPKHFISVVEDISERKRATDALHTIASATASVTEEEFFRSLVSHLAAAAAVTYAFVGELIDGQPERVRTLAMWAGNGYGDQVSYDVHGTPCERVMSRRVACFYPHSVQQQFPADSFLAEMRIESYYGLPLLDRDGRILGILAILHDQPLSMLPGMEQMLVIFAGRGGVELERKRTLEALRFSDQALRQLIEEREQLAQDLHDGIIQSIYAAGLGLEEARRLVQEGSLSAVAQIRTVIGDLNSLIEDVRNHIVRKPREITNGQQLKLALERLVRVLRTCPTMDIVATIDRRAADLLQPAEATHLYYIAAEALSNAVRHSQARHCVLTLGLVRGAVRLDVTDDGQGFDPALSAHEGHGLRNLSGRAAKLGTRLRIESSPGAGARMAIDVPKESHDDGAEA